VSATDTYGIALRQGHILGERTEFTLRNLGVPLRQGHILIKGTDNTLGYFVHRGRVELREAYHLIWCLFIPNQNLSTTDFKFQERQQQDIILMLPIHKLLYYFQYTSLAFACILPVLLFSFTGHCPVSINYDETLELDASITQSICGE
jgi:hypothetical protein